MNIIHQHIRVFENVQTWIPHVIVVRTSNPGTSANNQYIITTTPYANYNIKTSDGQDINVNADIAGMYTITFPSPGDYTLEITGGEWVGGYYGSHDPQKLLRILQWGNVDHSRLFCGTCSNLIISAIDAPKGLGGSQGGANQVFAYCSSITNVEGLAPWDVSNVETMNQMFIACTNIIMNPLVNWNVVSLISATAFMAGVPNTPARQTQLTLLYQQWASKLPVSTGTLDFGSIKYNSSATNARNVILSKGWTIIDGGL